MATYEVTVSVRFTARHSVALPDGTMESPHGHQWRVTAAFRAGNLDEDGFVVDFDALDKALKDISDTLEGADLNRLPVMDERGATAERMAEFLAGQIKRRLGRDVYCVRLTEAPGCSAAFYPNPDEAPAR